MLLDGERVEAGAVPVEPEASLWRGGGWFETLAVHAGEVYNLEPHLRRLRGSLPSALRDSLPDDLGSHLQELADETHTPSRLKLVVWEEDEPRHAAWVRPYDPPSPESYRRGIELEVSLRSHPPRWPQSRQKRTAYAHVMESRRRADAWDVAYCDLEGRLWETGVANVFWLREGTLHMPPAGPHLLRGTVLDALSIRAEQRGMQVVEVSEPWTRLGRWMGVCNSLIGMLPVRRLGTRGLPVDPDGTPWNELRRKMLSDRVWPDWHGAHR